MKKRTILILACVLIAAFLSTAAALGFLFGGGTGGSMRYVAAPEAAFEGLRSGRVAAANPDGDKLLITGVNCDLFLWDAIKGERVPVTFPRAQDAEAVAESIVKNSETFNRLKRDQREAYLQKQQDAIEAYLSDRGLGAFENLDQIVECLVVKDGSTAFISRCTQLSGAFALVDYNAVCLGINLDTGAAYALKRLGAVNLSLCGSRVLCSEGILDLATGEAAVPEMPEGWTGGDDAAIKDKNIESAVAVQMLPGEMRFLIVAGTAWEKTENDMVHTEYLILRDLRGVSQCVSLGECGFSRSNDRILLTESERYALVFNSSAAYHSGAKLVDLQTGEIKQVDGLLPIAAAGNRFLCYDQKQYRPCLLDAETGKTVRVNASASAGDPEWLGPIRPFQNAVFNGKMLFPQSEAYQGYLILE